MNIEDGDIFPAAFEDHGPDHVLRHVRLSHRQFQSYEEYYSVRDNLYQDFNDDTGELAIGSFGFSKSPDLSFIAKASDKFILENMSTSPKVEPKHFCNSIRGAVQLILDQESDSTKSIFPKGRSRKYVYSDKEKEWIQIK